MAVASIEPVRVRRFDPAALRGKPVERRVRTPRRALAVGAILAGGLLQHVMATTPVEPQPSPLAVVAPALVPPAPRPLPSSTPRHGSLARGSRAHRHAAARPAPAVPKPAARPAPAVLKKATRPVPARPTRITPVGTGHVLRHVGPPPDRSPGPGQRVHHVASPPARPPHISALLPPVGPAGDALRVAMAPNPQGAIMHAPSVSVAAVRATLEAAGSPALDASYADGKDVAEYLWDAGRFLGVDPAVVMAIFRHESNFGTLGVARLTDSVGNIRPLPGQPALRGYRLYHSWQEGIDDCYRLLLSYARHGAATIPVALPVWAPPTDNNDDGSYIASVLGTMGALYAQSAKS